MNSNGWIEKPISELCDFTNGYGFTPSDWSDEGLPIIRIQNLNGSRDFNYYGGAPDERWIVRPGDILFAWAGTKGVSFGPTIWKDMKGVLNQHIYLVHPKNGVNREWLYFALRVATDRIEAKAHGFKSTLLHVRKSDITGQKVALPAWKEQKKIAKILGCLDDHIELHKKLITIKTHLRQGLTGQLMTGGKRFPGYETRPWQEARFGDFLNESRIPGSDGAKAKKISVKLYGKGVIEKAEKIPGSANTKYYVRRTGQFIYSKLDFLNGAFGLIPQRLDGYESTLDLPAFDIDDRLDPLWLVAYVSRSKFYQGYAHVAEGGRKARRVQPDEFLKTKGRFPSIEEQRRIAAALNACDREIDLLRLQLAAIERQYQCLMPKMLTGQIRVKIEPEWKG